MRRAGSGDELTLWERAPGSDEAPHEQAVEVRLHGSTAFLPCADARLGSLPEGSLSALPDVLKSALAHPAIVGLSNRDDHLLWLVDLRLLPTP